MQQTLPRLKRPQPLDTRRLTLGVIFAAIVLLLGSVYFLNQFRTQRQAMQRNDVLLRLWEEQILTATPAAQERERLRGQLATVQVRFADASGLLPGSQVEVAILERIVEAAERSGVELSTLQEKGAPFQEGSLLGWEYDVVATGELERVMDFTARLEQEAFPAAYFSDPVLNENEEGDYVLAGLLTVYGSTLSTSGLVAGTQVPADQIGAQLRADAIAARERGDYERALSLLLRLKALEPDATDVDGMLYDTYLAYGDALATQNRPELAKSQYEAAVAIDPNGQQALARLVQIAARITPSAPAVAMDQTPSPSPSPSITMAVVASPPASPTQQEPSLPPSLPPTVAPPPARPSPSPAPPPPPPPPPPQPTRTTAPTVELPPTVTAGPSVTPNPSGTATSTVTAGPSPTIDPSVSPSATPTASATTFAGTPNPYPFGALSPFYLPNCGLTQIMGTIRESGTNAPVNGVTVRVWWDGAGPQEIYSLPSGADPRRRAGEWDVVLANYAKPGRWYIGIVNRDTGELISPVQTVETDDRDCGPTGSGHQVVIQDWVRFGGAVGTPVVTNTPTRTPNPSASITPTPTGTLSPTVTPTPTATAIVFHRNEEPDLVIPDTAPGVITSTLQVAGAPNPRLVSVFVNIEHQDAGDLIIDLIHPDGSVVRIHNQGEDAGVTTGIRRLFDITGANLDRLKGKNPNGDWRLRVTDGIEGRTGRLLSWELRITP